MTDAEGDHDRYELTVLTFACFPITMDWEWGGCALGRVAVVWYGSSASEVETTRYEGNKALKDCSTSFETKLP